MTHHFCFQVLQETIQIIPDCHRRLVAAKSELENLVQELEPDFSEEKDFETAKEVLKDSEKYLGED